MTTGEVKAGATFADVLTLWLCDRMCPQNERLKQELQSLQQTLHDMSLTRTPGGGGTCHRDGIMI